jgi:hypothetical protein
MNRKKIAKAIILQDCWDRLKARGQNLTGTPASDRHHRAGFAVSLPYSVNEDLVAVPPKMSKNRSPLVCASCAQS